MVLCFVFRLYQVAELTVLSVIRGRTKHDVLCSAQQRSSHQQVFERCIFVLLLRIV